VHRAWAYNGSVVEPVVGLEAEPLIRGQGQSSLKPKNFVVGVAKPLKAKKFSRGRGKAP